MKQLTLVPEGGLCNRIYAITSAIGFAKNHNLHLTVIWFKDWGMGAGFHDLFTLSSTVENVEIKDARFIDFFKFAKPIKSNFFFPKLYQKLKFDTVYFWYKEQVSVEKWYNFNAGANKFYLFHCQKFYGDCEFLNLLSPVNSIQKRINEQLTLISPDTIGVHIRRTDLYQSIQESPLLEFVNRMKQEIEAEPATNFYVASDSKDEKSELKAIFGNRIIMMNKFVRRDTKEGIIEALMELFTLAGTKKIYGSGGSTYSTLAARLSNIPIEIICKK